MSAAIDAMPRRRDKMRQVVHLELHTGDLAGAGDLYRALLGWRTEEITVRHGSYHALVLGDRLDGGIVQCGAARATWVPYVEVDDVEATTERGRALGASVLLEPREGPAGWRSVLSTRVGGEIALWQPKRPLAPEAL